MGDQLFLAKCLKYYKRKEVQEAIFRHADDREISPRYGDGFGKRPDALEYPKDIIEFAKRKMTSLHCSEERWENPLMIQTGMSRKDANELRIGWDLVLDIDAPDWEISRLTAWLFVKAIEAHNVKSVTVKFSGNKGWHIGVPWESFPDMITAEDGEELKTNDLFPEIPRAIATYLIDFIGNADNGLVTIDKDIVTFGGKIKANLGDLAKKVKKQKQDIVKRYDPGKKRFVMSDHGMFALLCESCGHQPEKRYTQKERDNVQDMDHVCIKCGSWMDFHSLSKEDSPKSELQARLKIDEIVEVDTVLLASRHLYRMPYSLHEKSGLAGVVIPNEDILNFKKKDADPDKISFDLSFLKVSKRNDAEQLMRNAWEFAQRTRPQERRQRTEFEDVGEMIPEEFFPPCIRNILAGIPDGKKRAMFALTNFFRVCGWPPEMIDEKLHEWNEKNPEQLREVLLQGHLRQALRKKERIPPPNCKSFYQELGVCKPDHTCNTIKNPAQYAVKLVKIGKRKKK